ncbi:MAG: ribosomal RNA small subunit methyltransferase A [Chloroflexi bacterium]|nr:ribosomal RNA small subunit methyltransferase A [Chloroflexota bacterium]
MTASSPQRNKARKSLGQHYLVDAVVLERILEAAELSAQDVVLEIGPGLGSLTRGLLERVASVIAVEMDPRLAASLASRLGNPANLTTVEADARTMDIGSLVGGQAGYKVVANLPYYAANPIVRRLLEAEPKPGLMVFMVQKEVAQVMVAEPGRMGLLSVATQYYARPSLVCDVPPEAFNPPPKITSAVVRLEVRPEPAVAVADRDAFFALVRAGFSAPRKQLRNSLSHGLGVPGAEVGEFLEGLDLDGSRRAETLTIEEWAALYRGWETRTTQTE